MSITIPPVAEGVRNASDLYNGWYGDVGPLPWTDAEFHDRLTWLSEQNGVGPFVSVQFASALTEGPEARFTPTVVNIGLDGGQFADLDCRYIRHATEACFATLYQLKNAAVAPQIKPYPGFAVRHPASASPIGSAWPTHPWSARGRSMFHVADGDTLPEGANWEQSDGVYVKRRFVVIPGSGPFGTGAKTALAWERVYSR